MKKFFKKNYLIIIFFVLVFLWFSLFGFFIYKNSRYNFYEKMIIKEVVEDYDFENYFYVIEEVKNNNKYEYACFVKIYGNNKNSSINYVVRFVIVKDGKVITERILYER